MTAAVVAILAPLLLAALILAVRRGAAWLALLGATASLAGALGGLVRVSGEGRAGQQVAFGGLPGLPLRLALDPLAAVLSVTVAVVALAVLVFAVGYMAQEPDRPRFFAGMCFFSGAMQLLVYAGDWLLLLAAWELIGLASYLLIGFWFERPGVGAAATRAFVTTRAADLGLYLAVFILVSASGTSEVAATFGVVGPAVPLASLLLLLAAMGKAAQVPFQGWLQDAMLGPTPVSALLHSATLVAAGAILLVRISPLLPPGVLPVVGVVGGGTALLTGLTALAQRDLKRLLAASTSSQLGFMLLAVGAGSPAAATVHLVAHAAMKGALFLGAGIFQHAFDDTAFDALRGAGRAYRVPFALFAVAGLALVGVPPLAGFWSKDAIEAAALAAPAAPLLTPLAFVGTALTGAYVARALRLLWQGDAPRRDVSGLGWMLFGMALLALLAATLGLAARPIAALLRAELPESTLSLAGTLVFAALGLLAGWLLTADRLLGPARSLAEGGFRLRGGWRDVAVRPALALAHRADGIDGVLDAGSRWLGRASLVLARGPVRSVDAGLYEGVLAGGQRSLQTGRGSRGFDERGLDGLISALVRATWQLGGRARGLQSGLVFRELALAAAGAALAVAILLIARP